MTVSEFVKATRSKDGKVIILVEDHKTDKTGPAAVALDLDQQKMFKLFLKRQQKK